jgi:hypothetical protein
MTGRKGETYVQYNGVPGLIFDVLETYFGEWHNQDQIIVAVQRMRPEAQVNTIRRGLYRLAGRELIEHSIDHNGRAEFRVNQRSY